MRFNIFCIFKNNDQDIDNIILHEYANKQISPQCTINLIRCYLGYYCLKKFIIQLEKEYDLTNIFIDVYRNPYNESEDEYHGLCSFSIKDITTSCVVPNVSQLFKKTVNKSLWTVYRDIEFNKYVSTQLLTDNDLAIWYIHS
jgi:hypothetical protein